MSPKHHSTQGDSMTALDDITCEAADRWVSRLMGPPMSDAEHAQFRQWLLADPLHERAFNQAHTALTWTAETEVAEFESRRLQRERRRQPSRAYRPWALALACAAPLLMVVIFLLLRAGIRPSAAYETDIGETKVVSLYRSGSATLDTNTRLLWSEDSSHRNAELTHGQALFDIVHNPSKPFVLRVGNSEIRVLGTKFDVYRHEIPEDEVVLTVLEGLVQVSGPGGANSVPWHRELRAGEQIRYRDAYRDAEVTSDITSDVRSVTTNRLTSWTAHVFDAEDESLSDVVQQLSRYTRTPIKLDDQSLARVRIAATFDLRDIPRALQQLQTAARVRIEKTASGYIVHEENQDSNLAEHPVSRAQ